MGAKKGLEGKVEWKVLGGEQGKEIAVGFVIRGRDYDLDAAAASFGAKAAAEVAERLKQSTAPLGPDDREVEGQTQNAVALQPSGSVIARAQSAAGTMPIEKSEQERARQSASTPTAYGTRNWKYWKKHNASAAAQSVVSMPTPRASDDGANTIHSVTIKHEPGTGGMDLDTAEAPECGSTPPLVLGELKPRTQLVRSTVHWETASSSEEEGTAVKSRALVPFGSGLFAKNQETSVPLEAGSELLFPKLSPGFAGIYDSDSDFSRPSAGFTGDNLASVGDYATEVPEPTVLTEYAGTPQLEQHLMGSVGPEPTPLAYLPEPAVQISTPTTLPSKKPVEAAESKSKAEDPTLAGDTNKLKRKGACIAELEAEEEELEDQMLAIRLREKKRALAKRRRELGVE
ncbi:hypothetical protein LTR56_013020 [Elasticomyces elasticus]|nr:hypothetical protein LTR56_013020 [Elasticomyces elasticus]KAK3649304.1 hypothetical protein LTR22_013033 [Elasticomyces elasticus]KAK4928162.1 hypothetical protein LTR49_005100 [Elasticomyces elasticus]KAK5765914.1 hypothetical protein LTS12_003921 [Elasticomyces elasticus]